jgi:hypothetical protein
MLSRRSTCARKEPFCSRKLRTRPRIFLGPNLFAILGIEAEVEIL